VAPALACFLSGWLPTLKLLCGELDRGLVAARAVDVAVQRLVQLAEVTVCQAASIADGHLTAERHVVHAPQHAAVRGLGQDQFLRAQVAERCRRQALAAEFPRDQLGDQTAGCAQARRRNRRTQPRAVVYGTARRAAAGRTPHPPPVTSAITAPTVSATSSRQASTNAGNSAWLTRHAPQRSRGTKIFRQRPASRT
jgi:hypothetical protein